MDAVTGRGRLLFKIFPSIGAANTPVYSSIRTGFSFCPPRPGKKRLPSFFSPPREAWRIQDDARQMQDDRKSRPALLSPFPLFLLFPTSSLLSSRIPDLFRVFQDFTIRISGGRNFLPRKTVRTTLFLKRSFLELPLSFSDSMRSRTEFDQRLEDKKRILFRTPRPLFPQQMQKHIPFQGLEGFEQERLPPRRDGESLLFRQDPENFPEPFFQRNSFPKTGLEFRIWIFPGIPGKQTGKFFQHGDSFRDAFPEGIPESSPLFGTELF